MSISCGGREIDFRMRWGDYKLWSRGGRFLDEVG